MVRHTWVVMVIVLLGGGVSARGQVDSHVPPKNMPVQLLPSYVTSPPTPGARVFELPLACEPEADASPSVDSEDRSDDADDEGDPNARSVERMVTRARAVVEHTRAGRYEEAAEAGQALLESTRGDDWADYTWDLVGSATAWSFLQLGRYDEAATAHRLTVGHLEDPGVRRYHVVAGRAIDGAKAARSNDQDVPPAERIEEIEGFRGAIRKQLEKPVKQCRMHLTRIGASSSNAGRLRAVEAAYDELRRIRIIDPELGDELTDEFRKTVPVLVTECAAGALKKASDEHATLAALVRQPLRTKSLESWNTHVKRLWAAVSETKRLCRIHSYLRRLDLAGDADSRTPFQQADELIYSPRRPRFVFSTVGHRGPVGRELRRSVHETERPGLFAETEIPD